MTIETKFNVGDEVWFMHANKPIKGCVLRMDIAVARKGDGYSEDYEVEVDGFFHYQNYQSLFPTKEELLKSL